MGRVIALRSGVRVGMVAVAVLALSGVQPRAAVDQQPAASPALLPRVSQANTPPGAAPFVLTSPVSIVIASPAPRLNEIAALLADAVRTRTGFTVRVETGATAMRPGAIVIDALPATGIDESYDLTVDGTGVRIRGASPAGALWGVQTLRQLLPPSFDDPRGARPKAWTIAAVTIHDAPRFAWRGTMVDAGRHFFPADVIKRHIDLLSRYKMNVFHWHLTEDQGWRIAITKHPELTPRSAPGEPRPTAPATAVSTPRTRSAMSSNSRGCAASRWCRKSRCPAIPWPPSRRIPTLDARANR